MKRKTKGVLGIALVVVLLASLTVGLAGVPAGAASSNLKFTTLELPKVEAWGEEATFAVSEGNFWATPGIDVGPIAQTPDGDTLFAAAYDEGIFYEVMKSLDGGYSWTVTGFYAEAGAASGPVVGIVTSPEYADDTTVVVATEDDVYISDDGGKNFVNIPGIWGDGATITDLDVTITEGGDLAIMVGTSRADVTDAVLVTLGTSGGASTATWSTTEYQSGSYSALLNFVDAHTYVDSVPAAGTTGATFAAAADADFGFSYFQEAESGFGPQLELKFEDPGSTDYIDVTFMLQSNTTLNAWAAVTLASTFGEIGTWNGSIYTSFATVDLAQAAISTSNATWVLTKVRVELYDDPAPARTCYVDDVIIAGTTSDLEPSDVYVKKGLLNWKAQAINGANVLASAFLPTFAADSDIGMGTVVTTGATTTMTFSFEDISTGGGWGSSGIANAPITNASGNPFGSEFARIAFPDDFDAFGIGNNVCFVGIAEVGALGAITLSSDPPDGSDAYKVICKEAGTSTAVDLDVRGVITTLLPTATAVTSIDVCGNAEDATILVGTDVCNPGDTPSYWFIYKSEDSGVSWQFSFKQPTGDAMTRVLMAPDFGDSGLAYAATVGTGTSAFQRTTDGATSWNQISLIDYAQDGDYYATSNGFSAFGYNAEGTLWMTTSEQPIDVGTSDSTNGALWGRLDGKHWERILSYANAGVTAQLHRLDILGDGSAMFATDLNAGAIWRSTDMGATFPKKISTKTPLTTVAPVSATTLYTGSAGEIWWSTRSGTGWTKPDDSEIPAAAAIINIGVAGDVVLVGAVGGVFISDNGGVTVEKVGSGNPFGGPTIATSDLGFAGNGILYATSPTQLQVMRTVVDLDNPGDAEWVQIDDFQDSTGDVVYSAGNFAAGGPAIALPPSGVLYVIDATTVVTDTTPANYAGGLWRSVNPTADIDSVVPPYFERENKGLDDDDALGLLSLDLASTLAPTFFCANSTAANYWEQVVMFTDTLNVGVPLAMPDNNATGVGLLPEGEVYPEVTLAWQEMAGATSYQYQTAIDPEFKTQIPPGCGYTTSLAVGKIELNPNMTYYWRARVAANGSLIGAPLISPWSETWKFKTAIGASMARPALEAPEAGAIDVALSPTFEWSGIEWSEAYEFELGTDPTTTTGGYFAEPLVALVGTDALVSTAWKCDTTLDYEGRYYWHVKAIGVDTETPWSDVGTFVTMSVPAEPVTPGPALVIPPAEQITPAWIWAIVIIGAILVIALVVLIVTTRRAP